MKLICTLALAVLIGAIPAFGQSTASNVFSNFSVTGSAVGFMSASGAQPATVAEGSFKVTTNASVNYEHIAVPAVSNATYDFGTVSYQKPLASLIGKTAASKLTFDASGIEVEFMGGAGRLVQDGVNGYRVAWTAGAFAHLPLNKYFSFQLIGFQYLHGGIQNGFLTVPDVKSIQSGLQVTF